MYVSRRYCEPCTTSDISVYANTTPRVKILQLTAAVPSGDQEVAVAVGVHTGPLVRVAEAQRAVLVSIFWSLHASRVLFDTHHAETVR